MNFMENHSVYATVCLYTCILTALETNLVKSHHLLELSMTEYVLSHILMISDKNSTWLIYRQKVHQMYLKNMMTCGTFCVFAILCLIGYNCLKT